MEGVHQAEDKQGKAQKDAPDGGQVAGEGSGRGRLGHVVSFGCRSGPVREGFRRRSAAPGSVRKIHSVSFAKSSPAKMASDG